MPLPSMGLDRYLSLFYERLDDSSNSDRSSLTWLRESPEEKLSKTLSYALRRGFEKFPNLNVSREGYISIEELFQYDFLSKSSRCNTLLDS